MYMILYRVVLFTDFHLQFVIAYIQYAQTIHHLAKVMDEWFSCFFCFEAKQNGLAECHKLIYMYIVCLKVVGMKYTVKGIERTHTKIHCMLVTGQYD